MEFPIRINKYLAHTGVASRREADELIAKKQVKINGKISDTVNRNCKSSIQFKPGLTGNLQVILTSIIKFNKE